MKNSLIVIGATVFAITATPSMAMAGGNKGANVGSTTPVADAKMAQTVRDEIAKDSTLSAEAKNLKVSSGNGEITVTGTVPSEMEKAKVESIARASAGSKVVIDVAVE